MKARAVLAIAAAAVLLAAMSAKKQPSQAFKAQFILDAFDDSGGRRMANPRAAAAMSEEVRAAANRELTRESFGGAQQTQPDLEMINEAFAALQAMGLATVRRIG